MAITTKKLIAEEYVVSSSVTLMTQSLASGSTVFGDSLDDTHQFTGSVSISGSAGLSVKGDNNTSSQIKLQNTAGSSVWSITPIYNDDALGIRDESGNSIVYITDEGSTGRVGINNTSPSTFLHIAGGSEGSIGGLRVDHPEDSTSQTSGFYSLYLNNTNTTNGNHAAIYFGDGSGGASSILSSKINDHTNNYGDLQVWTRGANSTGIRLHIDQEGNIGIGETNPSSFVDITFAGDDGVAINSTTSNANLELQANGVMKWKFINAPSTHDLYIASAAGTPMLIQQGGNVGIGTTNPQKDLEVIVTTDNFVSFAVQHSPGQHAGIHFGYRENNNLYRHSQLRFQRTDRFANNAMGRIMLINKTATDSSNPGESDAHLTIDELGFVGIGRNVGGHYSTGPRIQALLHVSASNVVGTATASLHVEGSGSLVVSVDGTQGRLFSISDELSGSLFSANTISGLPVIEAFSDNKVTLGPYSNPVTVTSTGGVSGSATSTGSFGRIQVPKGRYLEFLEGGAGTADKWQIFNSNSNIFEIKSTAYGGSPITIDATGGGVNVAANLDVGAGVDVTGDSTFNGGITLTDGIAEIRMQESGDTNYFVALRSQHNAGDTFLLHGLKGDFLKHIRTDDTDEDTHTLRLGGALPRVDIVANSSVRMLIDENGNVGINESSPVAKLHVSTADSGVTPNAVADDLFVENNTHGGITIGTPNSVKGYLFFADPQDNAGAGINYNHATNKMSIAAGGTTRMVVSGSGKVGIGTNAPTESLMIRGNGTGTNGFAYPAIAGYTQSTKLWALEQHFGYEGRLALYDTGTLKVLFRASGSSYINTGSTLKFGIGTDSPSYKLHVNGTAFAKNLTLSGWSTGDGLTLNYGNSTGTVEAVSFLANGGTNGNIKMVMASANVGDMHFNASNRTNQIVAYRDGKVGIGTNVPSQLLDVYGSIQVYSDIRLYNGTSIRFHGNGVVGMNGSATTQTFGSTAGSVNTNFSVGGVTAAMVISGSTGNVGIGETNPSARLDIAAPASDGVSLEIGGAIESSAGLSTYGASATIVNKRNEADQHGLVVGAKNSDSFPLIVGRHDSTFNDLVVAGSGRVGIGVKAPTAALEIYGDGDSANQLRLRHNGSGTNGVLDLSVTDTEANVNANYSSTAIPLRFLTGATERVRIDTAGNVGIGTNNPQYYKLDVRGSGYFTGTVTLQGGGGTLNGDGSNLGGVIDLDIGSQSTNQGSRIKLNAGHSTGEFIIQARQATGYSNGNIGIYRRSGVTAYSTLMHIGGDGNVAIGTESPTQKFHVHGGHILITGGPSDGGSNGEVRFTYISESSYGVAAKIAGLRSDADQAKGGALAFYTQADNTSDGGTERMRIDNTGNVGIGKTSPSFTLDVNSRIRADSQVKVTEGNLGVNTHHQTTFANVQFGNGDSNRAVNLEFGNSYFNGYIDVIVTGGYGNQNTVGIIHKRFYYGFNPNGVIWQGSIGRIVDSFGPIATQIRITDTITWDSSNSKFYLPIVHTVSTGNGYVITVITHAQSYSDPTSLSLSSVYDYGSNPGVEYPSFYSGTTQVLAFDSSGDVTFNGNVSGSQHSTGSFGMLRVMDIKNQTYGNTTPSEMISTLNVYADKGAGPDQVVGHFLNDEASVNDGDSILRLEYSDDSSITSAQDFITFYNQSQEVGSINSQVAYSTFTGMHVSQRPSGSDFSNWKPGMVVKSTGKLIHTSSISNAWPEVELTSTQKDKACVGVFSYTSSMKTVKGLDSTLPRIYYNAIGEGLVRVTDTGGNIEVGDYICSSTRAGHGEKQDDDLLHNYTVAKATQPYNFASASNDSELGYKSVLIGCTYHCG